MSDNQLTIRDRLEGILRYLITIEQIFPKLYTNLEEPITTKSCQY